MVVHRGSSRRGDLFSPALSRPNVLVRRFQPRLRGHGRRPVHLRRTSSFVVKASSLFVSPRSPSRPISKNAVSYFLREVISEAGAVRQDVTTPLRAHSV